MRLNLPELPKHVIHAKHHVLPFPQAIEILKAWADDVYDDYFDEDGNRQNFEAFEAGDAFLVDSRETIRQYLGDVLAPYVR